MLSFEELEAIVNKIKEGLDETTSALVSEDLLSIVSNYKLGIDKIAELTGEVDKLKGEKDELLKVNGKLFQQIGFEKEEEEKPVEESLIEGEEPMSVEEVIDEKGELI